jgi:hypothetical protein
MGKLRSGGWGEYSADMIKMGNAYRSVRWKI